MYLPTLPALVLPRRRVSYLILPSLILLLSSAGISPTHAQTERFIMAPVGANNFINKPWELLYGPDDHLWVTERVLGNVVRIDPETAERDLLLSLDVYSTKVHEGLLGLCLHPEFSSDSPYVYLSYTYFSIIFLTQGESKQKIVRYTYEENDGEGSLTSPMTLIDDLPSNNDHNAGRIVFGPDQKLYYSLGDLGGNQLSNYCNPILSQVLPTQEEIDQQDWNHYQGKTLRINPDGSIPTDNPSLAGVQSHVYTYGHRNHQGLVFSSQGLLYSDEHGPNTDDEVNLILAGKNYGWPHVVGFQDDQAYDYCNWSTLPNCGNVDYQNGTCPDGATSSEESSFTAENYQEPIFSLFAVSDDYDFNNPACGNTWICRPNVAPSSLAIYEGDALPQWKNSLLVSSLKRGRIYRLKLSDEGTAIIGDTTEHFYTQNRYRDIEVAPDGKTFYILCDETGRTADASGLNATSALQHPGNILRFTLDETVSHEKELQSSTIAIWPNPTTDHIHIEIGALPTQTLKMVFINLFGERVRPEQTLGPGKHTLERANLPAGVYLLRFHTASAQWTKRIVLR